MSMIDKLGKIARTLNFFRLPAFVFGLACTIAVGLIIFTSRSPEEDLFLIPGFVGVVWACATYVFLASFNSVPQKAGRSWPFFRRVKRHALRGWYGVLAVIFFATSAVAIWVTFRLLSIWIRDYFG
jgi:energy-coupling factor transporter transmembrane protein EcfT